MNLLRSRRRRLIVGMLLLLGIAGGVFWFWLPDQRFVGTWAIYAIGRNGEWKIRYDWNGSGAYHDPKRGDWAPCRWYARGDKLRLPIQTVPPVGFRQRWIDWYDRIIGRGWSEYDVLAIKTDTIELKKRDSGELLTMKRVTD